MMSSNRKGSSPVMRRDSGGGKKDVSIAVLGESATGKSALVVRFLTGRFLHTYDPTLEDSYEKPMRLDGQKYILKIMDTAGQDDTHIEHYLSTADVLLLAFAMDRPSSLSEAKRIRKHADHLTGPSQKLPVVLVGCKSDLEMKVSTMEAMATAQDLECSYVETSSADDRNCGLAFKTAVRLHTHAQNEPSSPQNHHHHHSNYIHHYSPRPTRALVHRCKALLGVAHGRKEVQLDNLLYVGEH